MPDTSSAIADEAAKTVQFPAADGRSHRAIDTAISTCRLMSSTAKPSHSQVIAAVARNRDAEAG
jgi:hypothetical protein